MLVQYLVFRPDSLTYTVAKALSHGGHGIAIRTTDEELDTTPPNKICRRLFSTQGVTITGHDPQTLPSTIDRLIIQVFPRPLASLAPANRLAARARRITLISSGDRSRIRRRALALQWLEIRRLALHAWKVDRVAYKDGFYPKDLLGLAFPRVVTGFDVHSQFLDDPALFQAIHSRDWDPANRRPVLISFLGSQDPKARKKVLDDVRSLFRLPDGKAPTTPAGKTMYWHEYSDAAPRGLPPGDFVRVLTGSDFTLCPRGYSLLTHRPMEALLRGSIPVLAAEELDLYGVGLKDGENCIAVPTGAWPRVCQELTRMPEEQITRMRRRIATMYASHLNYEAVARRIRGNVGVADQEA